MAERAPRPPPSSSSSEQVTSLALPFSETGTYVVQVPKDQIYRVPPPENALIAERYRAPDSANNRNCCSPSYPVLCCYVITAILAVVAISAVVVSSVILKPKTPGFTLQRLVVRNRTSSSLEYDLSFSVSNPNKASGVVYKSQGATSVLSFGKRKLGTGKFPILQQGGGDTTSGVRVVVKGTDDRSSLPKEVQESLKGKKKGRLSLEVAMNVPVRMKTSSFKTGDAVLLVTCEFDVDTLAEGTRILSQDCNTQRG